ncbi:MAG TPA: 3-hydroxyacyl-CoA dehydrogenase NAD-binding domain-containing protein [Polyangiaceae bacterium]|nr:3-hydroxyacyl-CoA dehydrogenase NAD-binding domain-containing protein [Polyangiaceae bacterium]
MNIADIKVVGIIGAGQMGSGIAQVAASAGFRTLLTDRSEDLAVRAKQKIGAILEKQVAKGKMSDAAREQTLARLEPLGGVASLAAADFVIEAATENLELKLAILRDADAALKKGAILASNTSSISITKLAGATQRPALVIGMHFMNPVPVMKLVEIVRAIQTSPETYETTRALATTFGKTVIGSKDQPAFVVNRMLVPFLNEACFAVQEGLASPDDIDQGARLGLNHPMGPLELADFIGLDTLLAITEVLHRDFGDDKYRPAVLLRNLVAAGWLGKKSGRGFYAYDEKGEKQRSTIA